MLVILFIHNLDIGRASMNIYGYAWGVLGFLSGTQVSEGSFFLAFILAASGLVCLLLASTSGPD